MDPLKEGASSCAKQSSNLNHVDFRGTERGVVDPHRSGSPTSSTLRPGELLTQALARPRRRWSPTSHVPPSAESTGPPSPSPSNNPWFSRVTQPSTSCPCPSTTISVNRSPCEISTHHTMSKANPPHPRAVANGLPSYLPP
jgi:hypothetical protein